MKCVQLRKKLETENTTTVDQGTSSDRSAHCMFKACIDVSNACICVSRLLQTSGNDWHDEGQFLRLNKKKCEDLLSYLKRATESYECSIKCELVAREFLAAIQRAKFLVEESSDNKWLLKALELWDCSQHFREVFVDIFWWAHMMSLGVVNTRTQFSCWVEVLDIYSQEYNDQLSEAQRVDRNVLGEMVRTTLQMRPRASPVDAEHQLALLLGHRLDGCSMGDPPLLLKSFTFPIRTEIKAPDKSKCGQNGVVLIFPWVYDKPFALKMPQPTDLVSEDMFKHEFDIMDKHRSPYIVGVVGRWERPTSLATTLCPFLLMEAMEKNLEELCKSKKFGKPTGFSPWFGKPTGFSPLETITLMLPVAKALRFLHGKDIAHRDIKPQNIMCSNVTGDLDDITVKLVDLGDATADVSSIPLQNNRIAGTNGYMDPAMWKLDTQKRERNPDGYDLLRADVFSFAMVFSELLTWRSPWKEFDKKGVRQQKIEQDKLNSGARPQLAETLPEYVTFIVQCCWFKEPSLRPTFTHICSMLQNAKLLLRDNNFFGTHGDELFCYEDETCVVRTIGDRAFLDP